MNIIFIGPPFSGKGTQTRLLQEALQLPVFSMGQILRDEYEQKNPKAIEAMEQYILKGHHAPIRLKFDLLKKKLDNAQQGFIIDNFPATIEDLETFTLYLEERKLTIDKVIYLTLSMEGMLQRMKQRGRMDDAVEIVLKRRENQDKDRAPVINAFKQQGILEEINGEKSVEEVYSDIKKCLQIR